VNNDSELVASTTNLAELFISNTFGIARYAHCPIEGVTKID